MYSFSTIFYFLHVFQIQIMLQLPMAIVKQKVMNSSKRLKNVKRRQRNLVCALTQILLHPQDKNRNGVVHGKSQHTFILTQKQMDISKLHQWIPKCLFCKLPSTKVDRFARFPVGPKSIFYSAQAAKYMVSNTNL